MPNFVSIISRHPLARLAVGGSPHVASAVALLFSGRGGGGRFVSWARSVWSSWSVSGRPREVLAAGGPVVPLGPPWSPNPCRAHRRMHDFAVSTRSASGEGTACARSWACLLSFFFSVSLDIPSSLWRSLCRLRHRPAGAPPHRRRFGSNEWRSKELCPVLIASSYSSFQNSPS